jgi:uncharacterized membrane protein
MTTSSVSPQRSSRISLGTLIFAFIALMMLYVLKHNERFLIDAKDPVWHHYDPFKWWLLPHGLAAASALLLGPMQFSDRLRQKYTRLHRVVGRIYVAGALIGAPLGCYIQFFNERFGTSRSFSIAAVVDASLWTLTTAIALGFALKRKIPQHRQWMTRSYAVAIVFLEVRVISGLGGWDQNIAALETIVWVCLALSLLFADIVLQLQDLQRTRPVIAKAQSVAS